MSDYEKDGGIDFDAPEYNDSFMEKHMSQAFEEALASGTLALEPDMWWFDADGDVHFGRSYECGCCADLDCAILDDETKEWLAGKQPDIVVGNLLERIFSALEQEDFPIQTQFDKWNLGCAECAPVRFLREDLSGILADIKILPPRLAERISLWWLENDLLCFGEQKGGKLLPLPEVTIYTNSLVLPYLDMALPQEFGAGLPKLAPHVLVDKLLAGNGINAKFVIKK